MRNSAVLLSTLMVGLVLALSVAVLPAVSSAPSLGGSLGAAVSIHLPYVGKQHSPLAMTPTRTVTPVLTRTATPTPTRTHTPVAPTVHTLPITAGKPTAIEAYQAGNKFYVAESLGGKLLVFDGNTHELTKSISISGIVLGSNLVVNETYGRAYAASRIWDGSEFGNGSGLIYVVSTVSDTILTTINPIPPLGTSRYVMAHDEARDRVYVSAYGLIYIDVATNAVHPVALPVGEPFFFLINEMTVNEITNEVYLVQTGDYGYHRLWILDADAWTWSWVDFVPLGAYYPQHVAVSETENKVFVKLIGIPGQPEPGIYVQDRDNGSYAFIGNDDYGEMVVNELSGRLFSGVEVGQNAAVIDVTTNALFNVPLHALYGGAVAVNVRQSTDHAFVADQEYVALIDGANRSTRLFPMANTPTGGILVQDVAVNQSTGWVYVIPDDDWPFIAAVRDPPAGPLQ